MILDQSTLVLNQMQEGSGGFYGFQEADAVQGAGLDMKRARSSQAGTSCLVLARRNGNAPPLGTHRQDTQPGPQAFLHHETEAVSCQVGRKPCGAQTQAKTCHA